MCVTSVPACCPYHIPHRAESQQAGENLHILFTVSLNIAGFVYKMFKINVFNVDFGFNDVYNLNNSYQIICICLTVIDFVALFLKVR